MNDTHVRGFEDFDEICQNLDLSLNCSYEAGFIPTLIPTGKKLLAYQFNFTNRCIDNILSINN